MKILYKTIIPLVVLGICLSFGVKDTNAYYDISYWTSRGYSCVKTSSSFNFVYYNCTKTVVTGVKTTYDATKDNYRTLTGYRTDTPTTYTYSEIGTSWISTVGDGGGAADADSPFIYLYNMPEGEISVSLDSQLDTYYPNPVFNDKNGWVLNGEFGLTFTEDDELFYELKMNTVTLNRNGKNFSSKEEVSEYLKHSDFLTNLGFSDREKESSLEYFIPGLEEAKDTNYYYLTVLSSEAVNDISTLTVEPTPEDIVRQYFAVYPTNIPVKTTGDFVFPEANMKDGFTVKETGELLIKNGTYVSFK